MKTRLLFLLLITFLLSMTACDYVSVGFGGASLTIGSTPTEIVYPTVTPYPTSTAYPTYTAQPTYTAIPTIAMPVATATVTYKSITWKELAAFLEKDSTNQNDYSKDSNYMCVEFSTDLVNHLHAAGYDAWIVAVAWSDASLAGHAFVAVPTSDLGVVYIEPQGDIRYIPPAVGKPLCMNSDATACWTNKDNTAYLIIGSILDPAVCDTATNTCSGIIK
jgi:hypothetical protein